MNETALQDALANPKNLGEMTDADAVGTVGDDPVDVRPDPPQVGPAVGAE